jgi:polynucleotide 5'-hydroxyl-kinase GRC3/NOL9
MIRDLRLIAYFRQCLPRDFPVFSCDDLVQGFSAIDPFQLPLSKIQVIDLHCQVTAFTSLFRPYRSEELF